MNAYRVGAGGLTVIEYDTEETPDEQGRRLSDRLVCTATTREDAEYIADALTVVGPE